MNKSFGGCKIIVVTSIVVSRDNLLAGEDVSRVAFSKAYGGIRTLEQSRPVPEGGDVGVAVADVQLCQVRACRQLT